jgi:hypothetical protein
VPKTVAVQETKIAEVQEIRRNPELVKGSIAVVGIVTKRDDKPAFFLLSDRNVRCKEIPIIYEGRQPEAGTEIIAYGHFKRVNRELYEDMLWWEFFLEANKIKPTEDVYSGDLLYSIRQWLHGARELFK